MVRGLVCAGLMAATMAAPPAASLAAGVIALHAAVLNGATLGSAFYIAPGVAVTNAHVVRGLQPGDAVTLRAASGARAVATLIGVSARIDLAVLRGPAGFLPPAPGVDVAPRVGDMISAAGIRLRTGAEQVASVEAGGAVTDPAATLPRFGPGLIAAAPGVGPGFSGGPVIDGDGRLVGMVAALRGGGRVSPAAGSAFAPLRRAPAGVEAFVLRAGVVRAEALRLLRAAGG